MISDKKTNIFKKFNNIEIISLRMYKNDYLMKYIENIFEKENIKYSKETYKMIFEDIINISNNNIDKILMNIQTYMTKNKKTIRYNIKTKTKIKTMKEDKFVNDTMKILNITFKDFDLNKEEDRNFKEQLFYSEPFIIKSNIFENYPKLINNKYKNKLENMNNVINDFVSGDVISQIISEKQDYSLSNYNCYLNYIKPLNIVKGDYKRFFFTFPTNVTKDNKIINNNKKYIKIRDENNLRNIPLYEIYYYEDLIKSK
jgi:hypothetical protein